jgi:hypothetical protein
MATAAARLGDEIADWRQFIGIAFMPAFLSNGRAESTKTLSRASRNDRRTGRCGQMVMNINTVTANA